VVTLNPFAAEAGNLRLDMPVLGRQWSDHMLVHDDVTGDTYTWAERNYVRLNPHRVAHILQLLN
jgi:starch synthase (maltosyl-transferring)